MRLDHLSYVTSHDQLSDTVQRIGSRLGCTFTDGGIHPRFGTRNFTAALSNNQYIEIVCPLDHPATELSIWGKAVLKKANEGGGWLTWVFSTNEIAKFETKFGRKAVEGHRLRPDGTDLRWKQIGVKEISESRSLPFFIQWENSEHPSQAKDPQVRITRIVIADKDRLANSWFKYEILNALGDVSIEWVDSYSDEIGAGIIEVHLVTPEGTVTLD